MKIDSRTIWLGLFSIIVLVYSFASDPNGGGLTIAMMGQLATPILAVWFAFLVRKLLMNYVKMEDLYSKARESSAGSGLVFIGVCLVFYGLLGLFGGQVRAADTIKGYTATEYTTVIPSNADRHLPTLVLEQKKEWADHPKDGISHP